MDPIDAATAFLGSYDKDRGSMQNSTVQSETHTITGTATSDSADGLVMVDLEGYTISEDDQQSLELPTTVDVHEGDTVQVTLVGGVAKSPIVTGVVGGGDRLSGNVQDATEAASDAAEAASAASETATQAAATATAAATAVSNVTNYFFHDNDGAHVTTTPNDATTGNNVLINANGLDVRDGSTQVAYFHADSAQVGADGDSHITIGENSITMSVLYYNPWIPQPQYIIRDVFNVQYNVSNNYVYVFAPTDSLWLQAAHGNVTIASTDGNANASIRLRSGKMIVADENGNPLWTGTAQEMADALNYKATAPRIYTGTTVMNLGSTAVTERTLWQTSTFNSTFNCSNITYSQVFVSNGDTGSGTSGMGPLTAERWTSGTYAGWHVRWVNGATGNRRFNWTVIIPAEYSTV